jgi:hypothetical protein
MATIEIIGYDSNEDEYIVMAYDGDPDTTEGEEMRIEGFHVRVGSRDDSMEGRTRHRMSDVSRAVLIKSGAKDIPQSAGETW